MFVSSFIINNRLYSEFINAMNNGLKLDCVKHGYNFNENSNILPDIFGKTFVFEQFWILNTFLVSLNNLFFQQNFYSINPNSVSYERWQICTL